MAGTKIGGQRAAATNKAKHGEDFYAKIGAKGGKNGTTGGFYANRELASIAGSKGGKISRRQPSAKTLAARKRTADNATKQVMSYEVPHTRKHFLDRFKKVEA